MDEARSSNAAPSVEDLLPLVRGIARTISRALPPVVEVQELIHDGVLGLLESMRRFDPSRGVEFRAYATHRIRGAILDGLRERDPLPRSIRRALRAAEAALGSPGPCIRPTPPVTQLLSLDEAGPLAAPDGAPEEHVLAAEGREDLRRALAALPDRDRRILYLRFTQGWRLREVAEHYGISITRIAELQERAVGRLRKAMEVPHPSAYSPNGRPRRAKSTNGAP